MAEGKLLIGTRRYSSWSMRGWLAVRLAGLDVTEEVIPLDGGSAGSEVKRRTPAGLVPYLEHDGNRVWETIAIIEYCAELHPPLWPQSRAARTHARGHTALQSGAARVEFVDMTAEGGRMAVRWDKTMASVPFTFGL